VNRTNKRGCIVLLVLLALFGGIYFYLGRETDRSTPSPSQGTLPPPSDPGTKPGPQPTRPLQTNPAG
jgi:hypothetical protein